MYGPQSGKVKGKKVTLDRNRATPVKINDKLMWGDNKIISGLKIYEPNMAGLAHKKVKTIFGPGRTVKKLLYLPI